MNEKYMALKKTAQEKQKRGETLSEDEKYFLNFEPQEPMSYADRLKKYQGDLYAEFGTDEQKKRMSSHARILAHSASRAQAAHRRIW